jgi:hypothetical protein
MGGGERVERDRGVMVMVSSLARITRYIRKYTSESDSLGTEWG